MVRFSWLKLYQNNYRFSSRKMKVHLRMTSETRHSCTSTVPSAREQQEWN